MVQPIETFGDFLRHITRLVFWLFVISILILLPVGFIAEVFMPGSPFRASVVLGNPNSLICNDPLGGPGELLRWITGCQRQGPLWLFASPASPFFKIAVFPGSLTGLGIATVMILAERKLLAKMQLRVGPLYAGKFEGVLQPIADLFKLISKEIVTPSAADRLFFWAVPIAFVILAHAILTVVPLGPTTFIAQSSVGLLVVLAVAALFPLVVLLAAWASSSKYPFIGGLRALHQMVSYEIPLVLAALSVVVITGSLDLIRIADAQRSTWNLALVPLGAIVFYIAAMAELERIPFDMPEADSEIVAGWLTEYTGMHFGLIQVAVYIKFYALAVVFTHLFLGGWYGPAFLPPEATTILKAVLVMIAMIIPRGLFTRIRIDIMLRKGWAVLLVLAFLNLFIAVLWVSVGVAAPVAAL